MSTKCGRSDDIDSGIIDIFDCVIDSDVVGENDALYVSYSSSHDVVKIGYQGDGLSVGESGHNILEDGSSVNDVFVSTPLRLTGGADSSFDKSQVDVNMDCQGNLDKGPCDNPIQDSNDSNDLLSFVNQDSSMSEQDIRDILFEAGYSTDAINDIIISRAGAMFNESSASQLSINESVSSAESGINSAYEVLREIRVKNVNKVVIGSLNINSFASKFEQLREIIGKNLDILTIQETKLDQSFPTEQFTLEGYSKPYRLDRNRYGGGGIDICERGHP